MSDEEPTSRRARFCEACWAELSSVDIDCRLCGEPAPDAGEMPDEHPSPPESAREDLKQGGAGRRAIAAMAIVIALLSVLVVWLNFQVNAFNKLRVTREPVRSRAFAPPRAVQPPPGIDRSVGLVDFAGRWRVTAGAEQTGLDDVQFELVMDDGKLVTGGPVSLDSPKFSLEDGLLRGEIQSGPTRVHLTVSLLKDGRQMRLWIDPPIGPIIEMKARRL